MTFTHDYKYIGGSSVECKKSFIYQRVNALHGCIVSNFVHLNSFYFYLIRKCPQWLHYEYAPL